MIHTPNYITIDTSSENNTTPIENAVNTENHDTKINLSNEDKTTNKTTVLDIEELETVKNSQNVTQNARKKYWVMFWSSEPPQRKAQESGGGWWPFGYGAPQPPERQGPLNYKPETRNNFVKLVLTIVWIMLITTAMFISYVLITPDVKEFFQESGWTILLPALGLLLIVDYGMVCSPCTRTIPCNIIFLILAVVAMSLISAKITVHYRTEIVLYAILATAIVVFVCVLLACSAFDFTSYILYVVVFATAVSAFVLIVVMVQIFTGVMLKPVVLAVLCISTLVQAMMLTIQLQTILGGKTVELNESDYALGAFMIYTSIVDIFIKMMQIIGISDSM